MLKQFIDIIIAIYITGIVLTENLLDNKIIAHV